ncbi:MAG: HAD hydrolase-like protein [Gammaproteobacteria bacterium]|nr:HAD hydrolase-like protein [Gammaproteobacteria bacterium]
MHLLFDFDGTLVNSFPFVIEKTILLADEFHFKKIEAQEIEHLRDLSSKEVIQYLGVPFYKIPSLIRRMRQAVRSDITRMQPVPNIYQVLETLHQAKYCLGILTSNSKDNVSTWLIHHHMQHFFSFIHTESSFFSKKHLLKKTLKAYHIDARQTCYIGDETRDIDAANQNNIRSMAVTWGFNSEKVLLQHGPTYIVRQAEDILTVIQSEPWPLGR